MSTAIENFIESGWAVATGGDPQSPMLLRFRQPLPAPDEVAHLGEVLRVLWIYADEGTGALPTDEDADQMGRFENALCDALESDQTAVLTAVLTLDGARQWIFYTGDVQSCGDRINQMPQGEARYPLELDTFSDATWSYLRQDILGPLDDGT